MKEFKPFLIILIVVVLVVGAVTLLRPEQKVGNHTKDHRVPDYIFKLPLKTPQDRIERLNFVLKDGVKEFQLSTDEIRWEYAKGKFVHAWGYNGQIPGPEIRVAEGDKVRVIVKNNLPVGTSIHWHGVHVENKADGIPELTQYPIKPGETFVYEFTAKNAGTHFYHTHGSSHADTVLQLDMGLSGALIIEPKNLNDPRHSANYDREYVYLLDEWAVSDGVNHALELVGEHGEHAHGEGKGHDYNIFTVNGRIFPDIEPLMIKEGEKVLVRLINAGTQEMHPMHTHGHSFTVIARDGFLYPKLAQQTIDTLTVNPGERYDVVIVGDNPGVWLFHCHHIHHAAGGMIIPFFYEGHQPCCLD